jgi:hypothetical protein
MEERALPAAERGPVEALGWARSAPDVFIIMMKAGSVGASLVGFNFTT